MKHLFSILTALCVLLLSSCDTTAPHTNGHDLQLEYATSNGRLCKSGSVYYTYAWNRLLYYDDASDSSGVLCGRADCSHQDVNCNAYVDTSAAGIQVYDNKIYWIENFNTLCRADLDGSHHEQVRKVERIDGYDARLYLHRGFLYTSVGTVLVKGAQTWVDLNIYQYDMTDPQSEPNLLYTGTYDNNQEFSYQCRFSGDQIYFIVSYGGIGNDGVYEGELYQYDIQQKTLHPLWSGALYGYVFNVVLDEEGFHILTTHETWQGDQVSNSVQYMKYCFANQQMETSEIIDIPAEEGFWGMGLEEGYFMMLPGMMSSGSPYRIYDWNQNLIREGNISGNYLFCIGCDETGLLFQQEDLWGSPWKYRLIRIPFSPEQEEELLIQYTEEPT